MMPNFSASPNEFWAVFAENNAALARITTSDDPAYDAILNALQQIDPGLYIEVSTSSEINELVITADGNAELFGLVENIVAAAPKLDDWQVFALRRKLGFPESVVWQGVSVSMTELLFSPMGRQDSPDLGLCIFIPDLTESDLAEAHAAILRAIDFGLGEKVFSEQVQHVEVHPLPSGTDPEDLIPLVDLEDYIDWRNQQMVSDH